MAHAKDLHAELLSVPAAAPGTGTVTSVHVTSPLTGGGPGPVVNIGIQQFDSTHAGYVPLSDGSATKFLAADGNFKAIADPDAFVNLQAASPGVPDIGFVNVTGGVIFTSNGAVDALKAFGVNGLPGIVGQANDGGDGVEGIGINGGFGVSGSADTSSSGFFQSSSAANTAPTLVVQDITGQGAGGNAPLFQTQKPDNTPVFQIMPAAAGGGGNTAVVLSTDTDWANALNVLGPANGASLVNITPNGNDGSTGLFVNVVDNTGLSPNGISVQVSGSNSNFGITTQASDSGTGLRVLASGDTPEGILVDLSPTPVTGTGFGMQVSVQVGAIGIQTTSDAAHALEAFAANATSGFFQSAASANPSPTVVIQQNATASAPLLDLISQSGADNVVASRLAFSDTNAATTLGNAVIGLQTVAGAAPDLVFYMGGTDNDTPGNEYVRFDGGGGVTRFGLAGYGYVGIGFAGAFDAELLHLGPDASDGIAVFEGSASQLIFRDSTGDSFIGTDGAGGVELGVISGGRGAGGGGTNNVFLSALATFEVGIGQAATVGVPITLANDTSLTGKLHVGGTNTIGTHQLDVTGDAAVTTDFTAGAYHVGAFAGVDFSGAITNLTIVKGIVTAAS